MFAETMRAHRQRLSLTQEELAETTGLSVRNIVKIEGGKTSNPRAATVRLLADAFGLAGTDRQAFCQAATGQPTPARVPAQLPTDVAGFTGRTADLDQLDTIAGTTQDGPTFVVVAAVGGAAGIGKTALVIHWAHRVRSRFPDGQLFCDLQGFTHGMAPVDPAGALERLLRALGVPGEQVPPELDDRAGLWRSTLAGRRMLIVLDNAATAAQVRPLLPGVPGCLALVTSRHRLASLEATHTVSLDLLPASDALTLFTRTAGSHRLAVASPQLAADIVEQCGRLPLAIRIAAARLRSHPTWSLAELASRLRDHDQLLSELADDDGQRSVTAALDLSYQRLSADQRRMYRLAGPHPGSDLDPYAAAALTDTTLGHARRLLEQLHDAYLLQEPIPGRYAFHDLIRAHATKVATTVESEPDRRKALIRLLDLYRHTASVATDIAHPYLRKPNLHVPPADTPTPVLAGATAALAWLDLELPNLLAAAQLAATSGWHEHTVHLSTILDKHLRTSGHCPDVQTLNRQALAAARATGDRTGEMRALFGLAWGNVLEGEYDLAADQYQRLLEIGSATGNLTSQMDARNGFGDLLQRQGRYETASRNTERALEIAQAIGSVHGETWAMNGLGYQHLLLGELTRAFDDYRQSLTISQAAGDRICELYALLGLGHVDRRRARHARALSHYQHALEIAEEVGNHALRLSPLLGLGDIHRLQGRYRPAFGYYQQALDLVQETGNRQGRFEAHHALGRLHHATGRPDKALTQHQLALELTTELGQPNLARVHDGLAYAHRALGQDEQARRHWQQALDILIGLGIDHSADEEADVPAIRSRIASLDR